MKNDLKALLRVLALNVRRLRKERELSQEGLAELTGLHRTYVGAVERAERNVTLSTLCSFAGALKTTVPQLLTKEG
ncbi:MAG: helix-turn-helix transcriptional regulator [Verrucomicrobia bacterium]|nr:helix-turn-helix transcriptional regulator [Verrucomicrobiota bacterium]